MATAPADRCLVYAHWDIDGVIDPYVLHALREYRALAGRIIFVTTHYRHPCRELTDLVDAVIVRDNQGYDFMSWRCGLETIDVEAYDEIVFTNNSIFGPLWPLLPVFDSPVARTNDLWGMTTSLQQGLHLQSYFFCMSRTLLTSACGRALWRDAPCATRKRDVIQSHELTWLNRCVAAGHPTGAVFDARLHPTVPADEQGETTLVWRMLHRRSRRYRRHLDRPPYNPTHLQWRQVLESGVPFVKVELLRDNPMGVDTGLVMDWLETHTAYPVEFIHNNVARTRLRRRAA